MKNLLFDLKRKTFFKLTSLILIQTLVFSSILWADQNDQAGSIKIPSDIGTIVERHDSEKSGKIVIHIQDTHTSYSAQKYLSKILSYLNNEYDTSIVGLEGATGELDTSKFSRFPDKNAKEKVGDYFLKNGRIDGVEYYSIVENNGIKEDSVAVKGIEVDRLYRANMNAYLRSVSQQKNLLDFCGVYQDYLKKLKPDVYSAKLLEFDEINELYRNENLTFIDFCRELFSFSERNLVEYDELKHIGKLFSIIKLESSINFHRVDIERIQAINQLSKSSLKKEESADILSREMSFRTQKVSMDDFYRYLEETFARYDFGLDNFPNLKKYIAYVKTLSGVDHNKVLVEIDQLVDKIYGLFIENDTQRQLHEMAQLINIISRFPELQITNSEINRYKSLKEKYSCAKIVEFTTKLSAGLNIKPEKTFDTAQIEDNLALFEDFYRLAREREQAMVSNALKLMDESGKNKLILIAGGFHTRGISESLKQQNVSYVVITPRMESDYKSIPYTNLLQNAYSPLEEMLAASVSTLKVASWLTQNSPLAYPERVQVLSDKLRLLLSTTALNNEWNKIKSQYSATELKSLTPIIEKQLTDSINGIIRKAQFENFISIDSIRIDPATDKLSASVKIASIPDSIEVQMSQSAQTPDVPQEIGDHLLEVIRFSGGFTTQIYSPEGHNLMAENYAVVRNLIFNRVMESESDSAQIIAAIRSAVPDITMTDKDINSVIDEFKNMGYLSFSKSTGKYSISGDPFRLDVAYSVKNSLERVDENGKGSFKTGKITVADVPLDLGNIMRNLKIETLIFEPTLSIQSIEQVIQSLRSGMFDESIKPGAVLSPASGIQVTVNQPLASSSFIVSVMSKPYTADEEITVRENISRAFNLARIYDVSGKNEELITFEILKETIGKNIGSADIDYAVLSLSSTLTDGEKVVLINYLLGSVNLDKRESAVVEKNLRGMLNLSGDKQPSYTENVARLILGNEFESKYILALSIISIINPKIQLNDALKSSLIESVIATNAALKKRDPKGFGAWFGLIRREIASNGSESAFNTAVAKVLDSVSKQGIPALKNLSATENFALMGYARLNTDDIRDLWTVYEKDVAVTQNLADLGNTLDRFLNLIRARENYLKTSGSALPEVSIEMAELGDLIQRINQVKADSTVEAINKFNSANTGGIYFDLSRKLVEDNPDVVYEYLLMFSRPAQLDETKYPVAAKLKQILNDYLDVKNMWSSGNTSQAAAQMKIVAQDAAKYISENNFYILKPADAQTVNDDLFYLGEAIAGTPVDADKLFSGFNAIFMEYLHRIPIEHVPGALGEFGNYINGNILPQPGITDLVICLKGDDYTMTEFEVARQDKRDLYNELGITANGSKIYIDINRFKPQTGDSSEFFKNELINALSSRYNTVEKHLEKLREAGLPADSRLLRLSPESFVKMEDILDLGDGVTAQDVVPGASDIGTSIPVAISPGKYEDFVSNQKKLFDLIQSYVNQASFFVNNLSDYKSALLLLGEAGKLLDHLALFSPVLKRSVAEIIATDINELKNRLEGKPETAGETVLIYRSDKDLREIYPQIAEDEVISSILKGAFRDLSESVGEEYADG